MTCARAVDREDAAVGRSTTSSTRGRTAPRRERPPEFDTELDVGHLLRIALAVFGVLAIVIAVWILIPRSASYGGPLQDPDLSGSSSTGVKRAAGKAVSFGIFLPWNAGEQDAVLDKLVPLSTSEGLQIVGAGVLTPVDDGVGAAEGYPPAGMLKPPPVRGYVIPPGSSALDSYQIVVGVRAKEPGVHTIPGFRDPVPRRGNELPGGRAPGRVDLRAARGETRLPRQERHRGPAAGAPRVPRLPRQGSRPGLTPVSGLSG